MKHPAFRHGDVVQQVIDPDGSKLVLTKLQYISAVGKWKEALFAVMDGRDLEEVLKADEWVAAVSTAEHGVLFFIESSSLKRRWTQMTTPRWRTGWRATQRP